jgi:hypothetical protein
MWAVVVEKFSRSAVMQIIFCADPLDHTQADELYRREVEAAQQAGLQTALINYEALTYAEDSQTAIANIPLLENPQTVIYRGWMFKPQAYVALYEALNQKGWRLINDPAQYTCCHYLPESYPLVADHTPRSMWIECGVEVPMGEVKTLLQYFGMKPVILRDYAHSQKHYWAEASYIPVASDGEAVERVVKRFVELQGEELEGGLVFREFVELDSVGKHPKSGMPLSLEYRVFWLDGEPIAIAPYWEQIDYNDITPPVDEFRGIAQTIPSRFFTMDLARRVDGEWIIVELGDGQVAELPPRIDLARFYQRLASA